MASLIPAMALYCASPDSVSALPFRRSIFHRSRARLLSGQKSATLREMSVSYSASAQKGAEMITAQELRETGYAEGIAEAEKAIENGASVARLRRMRENYIMRGDSTDDPRLHGRADGITEVLHSNWDAVTGTWI